MPSHPADRSAASAEADYRKLANALPQIIWTCDARGQLDWVNDGWLELTGLTAEESLHDKGALVAVHPDDRQHVERQFAEAVATSSPCEIEYRVRTREGLFRFHLSRVVPVRGEDGAIVKWVAAAFDIHDRRQAEEAHRVSEGKLEAVFELSPQPTAITRMTDGVFLNVNDAFLKMTGFAREEVVGKSTVDLGIWTPEQRAALIAPVRTGTTEPFEVPYLTRDGREITVVLSGALVDLGGEPCLLSIATDVTKERAVEAALRRSEALARTRADELAALMDAVPAAVWISQDPACLEVHGNRTGRELLRIAPGQNLSKTAVDPATTAHFKVFANEIEIAPKDLPLQRAAQGFVMRDLEHEVHFDDGQVAHLYGSAVPLRDPSGAPRGSIGAFVDVTRLKQAEAVLREVDRRKDEFLALLSHELRNPLAPIVAAAELMQARGDVATPREREVILRQARQLMRLVDDLLDVSRVASGKVTLMRWPLELARVVATAVEATAPLLEEGRHQVRVDVPVEGLRVDADEVRLTQVVSNLLSNAARYTQPGGRIEVTARRVGPDVVLRVRDNGIGIDPGLLPHVFDMFVQGARGLDRSQGGLGLGLSLVRTLTTLHGGTVEARSDGPGRGSELMVRLPASAPEADDGAPAAVPADRPVTTERARRILVVDDNQEGAEMISSLLRGAGHDVKVAHDPIQALSFVDGFQPQVAILDIGLPVMDGYALGRELRARMADAPPILVALSGYGQEQDRRQSRRAGFTFHLAKPADAETLFRLVDALDE
jgi:PAS domain S-box-containing protein